MPERAAPPSASPLHLRVTRVLLVSAGLVVTVAGLKVAEAFFIPLLMALFLTVLCVPPMRWLERRGLPEWAAITLVIALATLVVLAIAVVIGGTIQRFYAELPFYRARLDGIVQSGLAWLGSYGIDLSAEDLSAKINTGYLMELAGTTASSVVSAFSSVVLVLLLMAFMLIELAGASDKVRRALGDPKADLSDLRRGAAQVQRYLAVKAFMSLINAGMAIGICFALDVDFALLWGLFAFLFNFIPNIGSILAGIAPALLALVTHGPARAALLAALYLAIDFVFGNLVEPRLMGRRLGLSPLVIIVSLVFWGWLWGPVGMLLSVPLTSALKLFLEHTDHAWLAVLLGTSDTPSPAKR
jgi:predicted PurR-regulated permease PerM